MTPENPHSQIDARLRDVPLPEGLLDRLRGAIVPDDAEVDRRLRDVAAPVGLADRIVAMIDDEVLVERLAEVPLPESLMPRLRVLPQLRRRSRLGSFALAASLMIALCAAWLGVLGGVAARMRPAEQVAQGPFVLPLSSPPAIDSGIAFVAPLVRREAPSPTPAVVAPELPQITIELAAASPQKAFEAGPAGILSQEFSRGLDVTANIYELRMTSPPYTHHTDDDLPELEPQPELLTGGFTLPVDPAFDRVAYFRDGVLPRVVLDDETPLRESHPPLSTRTASVERLRRQMEIGRSPQQHEIRVEDFLASLDYRFAPESRPRLAIRTAAGPSVFSDTGAGLLQLGVKAGALPRASSKGVHLIVALDVSASMRFRDRLQWCCEGLRRTLPHLESNDRLTLLAFNDELVASAENIAPDQLTSVYELLDRLHPHGHTNLSGILQEAAFMAADPDRHSRLVLITDGPGELPDPLSRQVVEMLDASYRSGVTTSVIELSDDVGADADLERLAGAGGGYYHQASSSQHIRWTLVETLSGRSSLVADDARLHITFNPKAVEAYRLLGHERTLTSDLARASISAALHSGEEASVLYEVWLRPGAEDRVAMAQVEWRDPVTGEIQKSQPQPISRLQFALSFEQSRLSLQAAAIAAEAAEVLRGSPFVAAPGRGLEDVLERAEHVPAALAKRPDFRRFVELLRAADRISVRRTGT
ncbi:MAG: DUF3520 domain-containing protein [Pirellulaceae bacterium]